MNPATDVKAFPVNARWFAGKDRPIGSVVRAAEFELPAGRLSLADVGYADGGGERYLLCESVDWAALLDRLGEGPIAAGDGRLELRGRAPIEGLTGEHIPATDQTNTLVVLGQRLLIKVYRRLEPGTHPEIEMLEALRGSDAPVPALLGSLHYVDSAGTETAVALLEEFVSGVEEGWEAPIERVADHLRGDRAAPLEEYRLAGAAAVELHAAALDRLGTRVATGADAAAIGELAASQLAEAAERDASLADLQAGLAAGLEPLELLTGTPLQRIHGDLHYAQFLRSPGSLAIIDFEGDPTRALAERRALASALHDVACLTRSIDHIGSAAAQRAGEAGRERWAEAATSALLEGYGPVDGELLRALEICKECSEVLYAQRTLPEWLYASVLGLQRLLGQGT